jgi:hypothetical protein
MRRQGSNSIWHLIIVLDQVRDNGRSDSGKKWTDLRYILEEEVIRLPVF